MEVSFKANYLRHAYIKEAVKDCPKLKRRQIAFVELDPLSLSDMKAINAAANEFEKNRISKSDEYRVKEYNYATDMRDDFDHLYAKGESDKFKHFYAATTQKDNFETLDFQKIIGLINVITDTETKMNEIKYFQVNPNTNHTAKNRPFFDVGRAIHRCILKIFTDRKIFLYPDDDAISFYIKCNYVENSKGQMVYNG